MRKLFVAVMATMLLAVAVPATHATSTCEKAYNARQKVIHKMGKRAPGRNICRQGMRYKAHHKWTRRDATAKEKKQYLHALKRLVAPSPPYLRGTAIPPAQPPAGTLSRGFAPAGLAGCIVAHESGGNPTATNGQYGGIAQWSHEAWVRMGGLRYASTPQGASYQQQLLVLGSGLARFGCNDWCPYDGC